MICVKCKSEWRTNKGIYVSLNKCPFCGEDIESKHDCNQKIFNNTKETLYFIAKQHGYAALLGK